MNLKGIEFLHSLAQWSGKGGMDLSAMQRAADYCGNPENKIPSVHVAGTNGKGSVAAMVSAILGASGKRVGLTISPHLESVNERIVVDGNPVSDDTLDSLGLEVKRITSGAGVTLSFFEAITLGFFYHCSNLKLDFMVVEVGLGGRLDATNIIERPEVCSIVSIDFDHQAILGDTLGKIAAEKAGIIKSHVPIVIGERKKEPLEVIETIAKRKQAQCFRLGAEFDFVSRDHESAGFYRRSEEIALLRPSLQGTHQLANSAIAFMIGEILEIKSPFIEQGIQETFWPGRLEKIIYKDRTCFLDAGHNPAGVKTLVEFIKSKKFQDVDVCFGALGTKNWREMVDLLVPLSRHWSVLQPDSSMAVQSSEVCDYLSCFRVSARNYGNDYQSYIESIPDSSRQAVPVVMVGSIYMMGALRRLMQIPKQPLWVRSST